MARRRWVSRVHLLTTVRDDPVLSLRGLAVVLHEIRTLRVRPATSIVPTPLRRRYHVPRRRLVHILALTGDVGTRVFVFPRLFELPNRHVGVWVVFRVDEAGRRVAVRGVFPRDGLQILFELASVPLSSKISGDLLVCVFAVRGE